LFSLAGLAPAPVGVKQARATLRREGLLPVAPEPAAGGEKPRSRRRIGARFFGGGEGVPVEARGLWFEIPRGPAILRGLDLRVQQGETVALMGRNGAGKSTLLRLLAGLIEPTRGGIHSSGRVALLLQNPGDYFLRERVDQELSASVLQRVGLAELSERNPRDISGGDRQRLALAIVSGEGEPPAVLALDEPTRGMDREGKADLAAELCRRAGEGQAVIVATHDPEFAASFAARALLLADGRIVADGDTSELLSGGWYFATETARILGGAGGALLPEQGVGLLRECRADDGHTTENVSQTGVFAGPSAGSDEGRSHTDVAERTAAQIARARP
jgi:energy-coupling factor transport system ATP-binding protein